MNRSWLPVVIGGILLVALFAIAGAHATPGAPLGPGQHVPLTGQVTAGGTR